MNYCIVVGSTRKNSQSFKVANFIQNFIENKFQNVASNLIDLTDNPLPFWDENLYDTIEEKNKIWAIVSSKLSKADAIILITPEWGGMVPSALKNFFHLCECNELAHKPALIISISAGSGGSYPVAELRMSSYKNTRICYLPDHLVIRNVEAVLNDFQCAESEADSAIRARLEYTLKILNIYAQAFISIRNDSWMKTVNHPYGM